MSAPCTCTSNCTCTEKGQIAASKPFDSSWTFDMERRMFYRIIDGQMEEVSLIEVLGRHDRSPKSDHEDTCPFCGGSTSMGYKS